MKSTPDTAIRCFVCGHALDEPDLFCLRCDKLRDDWNADRWDAEGGAHVDRDPGDEDDAA